MICPANPRRAPEPVVRFSVDHQAAPGNLLPALARLLIGIDRRRKAQQAQAQQQAGDGTEAQP